MAIVAGSSADVVIIGGGIVGASVAFHLAALDAGRIILLEREAMLGTGSTGRCAGGFRHQFSTEINIRLSQMSIPMILGFRDEMDCPVDVHQDGYLFLLSQEPDAEAFRKNVALQNRLGVPSEFLDPERISRIAPHVALDGVVAGAYCPLDGIGDPSGMTLGYAAAARRLGVEIRCGVGATGLRIAAGRVEGVETSEGRLPCRNVVDAAGPHAREVAAWSGIDLPVYPERRHVCTTFPFESAPRSHLMVIDFATTFYFHRESGGVLMGMGNPDEPSSFRLDVDPLFLDRVLETALLRFPALAEAGIRRAWAGLYEMSPDAHPILGRTRQIEGLFFANGFSGHGFQHAPAAGKLVAEEIVFGSARSLDISPLRLDRFETRALMLEHNVV
jgi:sarcosine oxidase subunit beta